MKVLFLADSIPPYSSGGAGNIAYGLAKKIADLGHKIFIITTVQKKADQGIKRDGNMNIYRIYSNFNSRWQSWIGLRNPRVIFQVKKLIKEIKPDIVHAHNVHRYLSYGCLKTAKRNAGTVFLTVHDVMLVHYGKLMPVDENYFYKIKTKDQLREAKKRYNPFRNKIIRHYLKYVDRIFTVSDSLKKILEINNIKNTETIYNGINVKDWEVPKAEIEILKKKYNLLNKKVLIFSARLIEAKGGDQLIEALVLVSREVSNFVLMIIGKEWAYTEKMKKMADSFNISNKIIFTGFLNEENLKIAYCASDISVFPSLCFETFGMGNLQAMACKLPVVSSFFGGPSEVVVDSKTGYLINPNNIKTMARKIIDLLKNPQKAKVFGEAGYERAKNVFSINTQARKTLENYKKYIRP